MPTLVYSDVDGVDRSFALGNEPITIGRAPECSIRSEDPRVSRVHARFFLEQGVLWIEDAGSSNGIYVGLNKVQRAPVPTGEIILVGSLMMRLLPASGTLPPPLGLHGTLATWLELERKSRVAIEDERDAFARRLGEIFAELAAAKKAATPIPVAPSNEPTPAGVPPEEFSEAIRLRDEAVARAVGLEKALAAMQDDAQALRDEHDKQRKTSTTELETIRVELAKAREAKMVAETQAGMAVAEKLAETDMVISNLQKDLETAKKSAMAPNDRLQQLTDQIAAITGRAEKAEKEMAAAQIRAQGAERNLAGANASAAKAEMRAAALDLQLKEAEATAKSAEQKRAEGAERIAQLESRAGKDQAAALETAEARAKKLAGDLAEATLSLDTQRDKLAAASKALAEAEAKVAAAEVAIEKAKDEAEARIVAAVAAGKAEVAKLGDSGKRVAELEARVAQLAQAEVAITAANTSRDAAVARAQASDLKAAEAQAKVDESDKRSTAAETMAKSMAKDVAEALRRAAEADSRFKAVGRDLQEAIKRADEAEAKTKTIDDMIARVEIAETTAKSASADADARIAAAAAETQKALEEGRAAAAAAIEKATADATARAAKAEQEAGAKVADTQQLLAARIEATRKELSTKLDQATRELAAERSTALQLVDRKTQLERELADLKVNLPALVKRAEAAETAKAALEARVAELDDRIVDLESHVQVSETASNATSAESKERIAALEKELATVRIAAQKSGELADSLRVKLKLVEGELASLERSRTDGDGALKTAHGKIAELEKLASERASLTADAKQQLQDALDREREMLASTEDLRRSAEAADLAIGRAGALQRQLDEAIHKLSYYERELGAAKSGTTGANEALGSAEARLRDVEARLRDSENDIVKAEKRAASFEMVSKDLERKLREATSGGETARGELDDAREEVAEARKEAAQAQQQATQAQQQAVALQQQVAQLQQQATAAQQEVARTQQQARADLEELEGQLAQLEQQLEQRPAARTSGGNLDADRKLADAVKRIADLEREVEKADNVRSFAAETEREIAQFQRDLREARTKLTQVTLERDRFESELRDVREADADTTNRRMAIDERGDARYDTVLAKFTEAQQMLQRAERETAALKKHTSDLEQRLEAALDHEEPTATGSQLPLAEIVEHVAVLEESIDSLRANMRAASDETALMDQTDSVVAVSSAVSQAAEHIERARASIRSLLKTIRT